MVHKTFGDGRMGGGLPNPHGLEKRLNFSEPERQVISEMTKTFVRGGRPGMDFSVEQKRFATEYVLHLLNGDYFDVDSKAWKQVRPDAPPDLVIQRALNAFTDFTSSGGDFLYHNDHVIPSTSIKRIAVALVEKIEENLGKFNDRDCAVSAIAILTGMRGEEVLPSAAGSWLTDHNFHPKIPFDAELTNKELIPEATEYARRNCSFLK